MIFWVVVKTLWSAFLCAAVQLAKPTWSKEAVLPEEEKSLLLRQGQNFQILPNQMKPRAPAM